MSRKYDVARPYTAAYVILRQGSKVAFIKRSNTDWMNGHYGLPAGKVEHGEPFLQAAAREAKEEAGVQVKPEDLRHAITVHRNVPDEDMVWVDVFFEVLEWAGEPYNAEPHMHSELVWLDPKNLPDNVTPPVKEAFAALAKGEHYLEYGWPA